MNDTTAEMLAEEIIINGEIDLSPEEARKLVWMLTGSLAGPRFAWLRRLLDEMVRQVIAAYDRNQQVTR